MSTPLKSSAISFGFKTLHTGSFRTDVREVPREPHQILGLIKLRQALKGFSIM